MLPKTFSSEFQKADAETVSISKYLDDPSPTAAGNIHPSIHEIVFKKNKFDHLLNRTDSAPFWALRSVSFPAVMSPAEGILLPISGRSFHSLFSGSGMGLKNAIRWLGRDVRTSKDSRR